MTEQNYEALRRAMVAGQLRTSAVNDARVVAAMGTVPRERFVAAAQAPLAYLDVGVPLGHGRTLPAPMVLGRLLTEARVRPGDRLLVIGSATGYAAAVAAGLAAAVVALEEDERLAGSVPLPANVTPAAGPLAGGWAAAAPYDVILFDGAVEHVPDAIVAQLADGGRLAAGMVVHGITRLAIGTRAGGGFAMVGFVEAEVPLLPGFAQPAGFRF